VGLDALPAVRPRDKDAVPSLDGLDLTNFKATCEITSIFSVSVEKKSMEDRLEENKKLR